MTDEPISARLDALRRRTSVLVPSAGFQGRVLAAVAARASTALRREVVRSARWFVPGALALAAASIVWAAKTEAPSSAALAAAEWRSEVDW